MTKKRTTYRGVTEGDLCTIAGSGQEVRLLAISNKPETQSRRIDTMYPDFKIHPICYVSVEVDGKLEQRAVSARHLFPLRADDHQRESESGDSDTAEDSVDESPRVGG